MLVGKLVKYVDWESSAGIASPNELLGLVVSVDNKECLPNLVSVLLPHGMITVYEDEVIEAYR